MAAFTHRKSVSSDLTDGSGLMPELKTALSEILCEPQVTIFAVKPVGGGCISSATKVTTNSRELLLKWNVSCPPDLFEREADGLRTLAHANKEIVIPKVFGARPPRDRCPALIVMEYLRTNDKITENDHNTLLGRGLATIHRTTAQSFGFESTTYCGATTQDNHWSNDWVEFFTKQRIIHLLKLIEIRRCPTAPWRHSLNLFVDKLPKLLTHNPQPSLIHGDLWSGNILKSENGPALIDPACAYTDREMEMGIATLFGGFPSRFWDAYQEAWAQPYGWQERNSVYQIYHILNHYYLFGGHYGAEALRIAKSFL